jgi:hypothetical protein
MGLPTKCSSFGRHPRHGTLHKFICANIISTPYGEMNKKFCFNLFFSFFKVQNSKQHLKFLKLANLMRANGNKILWNVKTCWINMFNLAKQVMSMYMPLLAKTAKNGPSLLIAKVIMNFCVM